MSAGELRPGSLRLAVDIGGTFTDAVLADDTGAMTPFKVPTTPDAPADGFMATVDLALGGRAADPDAIRFIAHATTVATNTVIEGGGAKVALVVTEGFRDMLEIARQIRPDLFDMLRDKPAPPVPRDLVFEVPERMGPDGAVITELRGEAVDALAGDIRAAGVDAVVVCLLHSYANPAHETAVAERLSDLLPEADMTTSSGVWPEFREYFRACTAVINAMIRPTVRGYLQAARKGLDDRGLRKPLWVMQSNGGVLGAERAVELPIQLIESGPAAGLTYAAYLGETLGLPNLVSFEVGGTTAKVGLVVDGQPAMTSEFEVGAMATSGEGRGRGSGYPIKTPVLDLIEIGAGGGSIAWLDSGGVLRVGPDSAGAVPGPACYQRGGKRATLTDANLALGRIDPDRFLGGEMSLSVDAAVEALAANCAKPLGMSVEEVARGVVAIATANMVRALRLATVERGHDPADFVLLAFGGAGPLHAVELAAEVGFDQVLVPQHPGVLSAAGLLVAPVQALETQTALVLLDDLDGDRVPELLAPLVERASAALRAQGVGEAAIEVTAAVDMRYLGQSFELTVPIGDATAPTSLESLAERFADQHRRSYGYAVSGEPIEVVNWRVTAKEAAAQPWRLERAPEATGAQREAPPASGIGDGQARSHERAALPAGASVSGPAVITEPNSTTHVPSGYRAAVDQWGNLVVRAEPGGGS